MTTRSHQIFRHQRDAIVAAAIHDGHTIRPAIVSDIGISESERLREEDPYTAILTQFVETQIVGTRSRFEVDLNRPREKAVYLKPDDAWGLTVWKSKPNSAVLAESLGEYDSFYADVKELLDDLVSEFRHVVVFDIHTYNHKRDGADGATADQATNPEVNLGTGTLDRDYWARLVDRFVSDLRSYPIAGRSLDVRENVKFQGGEFARWIHTHYPKQVCALSIEFKKFFMDEWSGEVDLATLMDLFDLLSSTIPGVRQSLDEM